MSITPAAAAGIHSPKVAVDKVRTPKINFSKANWNVLLNISAFILDSVEIVNRESLYTSEEVLPACERVLFHEQPGVTVVRENTVVGNNTRVAVWRALGALAARADYHVTRYRSSGGDELLVCR